MQPLTVQEDNTAQTGKHTDRQTDERGEEGKGYGSIQRFVPLFASSSSSLSLFFEGAGRLPITMSSSSAALSIIENPSSLSTTKSPEFDPESSFPIPDSASFSFSACRERGREREEKGERVTEEEGKRGVKERQEGARVRVCVCQREGEREKERERVYVREADRIW
jgi:hypothetical protein